MGGMLFSAQEISRFGDLKDSNKVVHVGLPSTLGCLPIDKGIWVSLSGNDGTPVRTKFKGFRDTFKAQTVELVMPTGPMIVDLIQQSTGIGIQRAKFLWEKFRDQLPDLLDDADMLRLLTSGLPHELISELVKFWRKNQTNVEQINWMMRAGFEARICIQMIDHYGDQVIARMKRNPYVALSFTGNWELVDDIAIRKLGVPQDDVRRVAAAIEETLAVKWLAGHSHATFDDLATPLKKLLTLNRINTKAQRIDLAITSATELLEKQGIAVLDHRNRISLTAVAALEQMVANAICKRISNKAAHLNSEAADQIKQFEIKERIELTYEQKRAIEIALESPLSIIKHSSDAGKNILLSCLTTCLKESGYSIKLLAFNNVLVNKLRPTTCAAKMTIQDYVYQLGKSSISGNLGNKEAIIIDECSMIDLVTFGQFFGYAPLSSKLILVGDPSQIKPSGFGLMFHPLVGNPWIPQTYFPPYKPLNCEILRLAKSVKNGSWPSTPLIAKSQISFFDCSEKEAHTLAVSNFLSSPTDSQILCSCIKGHTGTNRINQSVQSELHFDHPELFYRSEEFPDQLFGSGFRLDDRLICLKTHAQSGVHEGSLGVLTKIIHAQAQRPITVNEEGDPIYPVVGEILWNDGEHRLLTTDLLKNLTLAFAITIEQSKGLRWPKIIIPLNVPKLSNIDMFDRSMLYTAITRAEEKVTVLGNLELIRQKIADPPKIHHIKTLLSERINLNFAHRNEPHSKRSSREES